MHQDDAVRGALIGRGRQSAMNNAEQHYAQANPHAQRSQNMNNFRRAFAACLGNGVRTAFAFAEEVIPKIVDAATTR